MSLNFLTQWQEVTSQQPASYCMTITRPTYTTHPTIVW